MKRVEITVKRNGDTKLETSGFTGKACMEVDKVLKTLSDDIKNTKKSEYFATEQPNDVTIVGSN